MSIFVHIDGIEGETADAGHPGWLDVHDVTLASRRRITSKTSTRGDRESSNAELQDLVLTRRMDSASPQLFLEACCGRGKTVEIRLTKSGNGTGADVFMAFMIRNAVISAYETKAKSRRNERPWEKVTVSFTDIEARYTPYSDKGEPLSPIVKGFDASRNQSR